MARQNRTYSFLNIAAAIDGPGGAFSLSGASKEGISIEYSEDKATMINGADGDYMHSLHAAKGGMITIRLLKTNPCNQLLQAMYEFDTSSAANYGQNTITVRDVQRGDNINGSGAGFRKFPTITYSEDGNVNEWSFNVGELNMQLGTGTPARA